MGRREVKCLCYKSTSLLYLKNEGEVDNRVCLANAGKIEGPIVEVSKSVHVPGAPPSGFWSNWPLL
jgi:hypothetical protein